MSAAGNSRRKARLALIAILVATALIASIRIGVALGSGSISDKHGHDWARSREPGHFWLLLLPWAIYVAIPAAAAIAIARQPDAGPNPDRKA